MKTIFVCIIILFASTLSMAEDNQSEYVKFINIPEFMNQEYNINSLNRRVLKIPRMWGEDYVVQPHQHGDYFYYVRYDYSSYDIHLYFYNDLKYFYDFLKNPGRLGFSIGYAERDDIGIFARVNAFGDYGDRGNLIFARNNVLVVNQFSKSTLEEAIKFSKLLDEKIINHDPIVTFGKPQEIWQTPLPRKNVMVGVDAPLNFDIHKGKQVFNTIWTSKANYNVLQHVDGPAEVIYKNNDYIGNDIFYYACILEGEEVVAVSREINVGLSKVNGFEDY